MFEFINQNSGFFLVLFSFIVAISTLIYAILTIKLVKETRKMRVTQTEPNIFISLRSKEEYIGLIDLVIENIGSGAAYDIKFDISPDFELRKGKKLSEVRFIKKGLRYPNCPPKLVPPGELRFSCYNRHYQSEREALLRRLMMSGKYGKRYTPKFKFQVVMEVIKSSKAVAQIARGYGVHPITIHKWKKEFEEKGPEIFGEKTTIHEYERKIRELEQLIGHKEVEIALLKNFLTGDSGERKRSS